jgi:protocatechuate 3,4-dioxygenase beta subunit
MTSMRIVRHSTALDGLLGTLDTVHNPWPDLVSVSRTRKETGLSSARSLRRVLPVAVTVALALLQTVGVHATWSDGPKAAGEGAPATAELAGADEPGPRLVVAGRVFEPDGETPAAGVTLYVYQTDRSGRYAPRGESVPRLRAWMTTDQEGRYEYRTVRPASYPGGRVPQHVHTQLWGAGWPKQWNRSLEFADDPLMSDRRRSDSAAEGRFAWVCSTATAADDVERCTHDLRLKRTGDRFEPNIDHGSIPKDQEAGSGGRRTRE